MKPDEKYEYHGTKPGEGESIDPIAIMHHGYDATVDTLKCEVSYYCMAITNSCMGITFVALPSP